MPRNVLKMNVNSNTKTCVSMVTGYNATVLAYGQTGSGKTFSMGGCYEDSLSGDEASMGIIPRVLKELFNGFENKAAEFDFDVKVSYIEVSVVYSQN